MAEARGISFIVGGQLYAVPFHWVRELVDDPDLLPTPDEGDLKGLARVRDQWVPVIPLGVTSAQAVLRGGTVMVVIGGDGARLGILVDEVRGLIEWRGSARPERGLSSVRAPVTSSVEGVVTWIDPVELVAGREELFTEIQGDAMSKTTTGTPVTHVVEFRLGEDLFGINVARVFEVIRYPAVRVLPHTPPFLEGAAELRGAVLPIVDLRKRFGIDPGPPAPETRVLVTDLGGERIGLVVDRVLGVIRLAASELQPAPKFFKGLAARYLEALVPREDRSVIVLNTDEILTSKEKIQLRGAGRSSGAKEPEEG